MVALCLAFHLDPAAAGLVGRGVEVNQTVALPALGVGCIHPVERDTEYLAIDMFSRPDLATAIAEGLDRAGERAENPDGRMEHTVDKLK